MSTPRARVRLIDVSMLVSALALLLAILAG